MRNFIVLIVSLILLGSAAHAQTDFVVEEGRTWTNFGADPAYQTREEAIADAPNVFRAVGYSEEFIRLAAVAMQQPGTDCQIPNGTRAYFMRTGTDGIWMDVLVDFVDPPVENMSYSAPAVCWEVPQDGYVVIIAIPLICNNLQNIHQEQPVQWVEVPVRQEVDCAAINVPETLSGDIIHVAFSSETDRLRDSPCWGLLSDGELSELPSPCSDCGWETYDRDLRRRYDLSVVQRNNWTTQEGGMQLLIVPHYVAETITGICITRDERRSCSVRVHALGDSNHPNDWEEHERGQLFVQDEYIVKHITLLSQPPAHLWRWPRRGDRQCGR